MQKLDGSATFYRRSASVLQSVANVFGFAALNFDRSASVFRRFDSIFKLSANVFRFPAQNTDGSPTHFQRAATLYIRAAPISQRSADFIRYAALLFICAAPVYKPPELEVGFGLGRGLVHVPPNADRDKASRHIEIHHRLPLKAHRQSEKRRHERVN